MGDLVMLTVPVMPCTARYAGQKPVGATVGKAACGCTVWLGPAEQRSATRRTMTVCYDCFDDQPSLNFAIRQHLASQLRAQIRAEVRGGYG
ncbi:MAG: hypothetical protein WCI74_07415 [Actinomycetes bacterium]